MRNFITMLQQLNWMRMEIACGSLSDLTRWLKRWCSFCREGKSLCLPLSACQCNYNHMGMGGDRDTQLIMALIICWKWEAFHWVSCVRTRAVMYVCFCICIARWNTSSTYWFPKAHPEKTSNKSFVWLIHNTNFGLICTQRLWILSSSKIAPVEIQFLSNPTHSFLLSQNFNAFFFKLPIFQKRHLGANHIQPQSCSALPSFSLKLPPRVLLLRSHWMSGSSLQLMQSPHDQTPTSLRVRER